MTSRPRLAFHTLLLLTTLLGGLALPVPARANPGPGVVLAMAPPDPSGGVGQFSGHLGTPHAYEGQLRPLIMSFSAHDRITPWLFISLAMEANPLPGDDTFYGANALGPTLVAGKPKTKGFRVVFAPRAGFDSRRADAWAFHLGMHVVADGPLAWDGALRVFIGPRYTFHSETDGRDFGDPNIRTHHAGVTAGLTAHLAARFDMSVTATVPLFRVDMADMTKEILSPLAPTASVQFTVHAGPMLAGRAVVPGPSGSTAPAAPAEPTP